MARWVRIIQGGSTNAYYNLDSGDDVVVRPVEKEDTTWVIEVYSGWGATDRFGLTAVFDTEDAAADALRNLLGGADVTPTS